MVAILFLRAFVGIQNYHLIDSGRTLVLCTPISFRSFL